mmetsp:Transcript_17727/g.17809  ORF Transcript_17727/g.17809 Transcript_17727/m.17809 type:complete len:130 (-) Transcript_17727:89-478(-)
MCDRIWRYRESSTVRPCSWVRLVLVLGCGSGSGCGCGCGSTPSLSSAVDSRRRISLALPSLTLAADPIPALLLVSLASLRALVSLPTLALLAALRRASSVARKESELTTEARMEEGLLAEPAISPEEAK